MPLDLSAINRAGADPREGLPPIGSPEQISQDAAERKKLLTKPTKARTLTKALGIPLMVAGNALDFGTTERMLGSGNGVELNPVMRSKAVRYGLKPAMTTGAIWGVKSELDKGHNKAALVKSLIAGALPLAFGLSNMHQYNKAQKLLGRK